MSRDYWERVKATVASYRKPGDEVRCIRVYSEAGCTCQMCGHAPITWNHVLRNLRTGMDLIVGSECINNYKVVTGEQIIFPGRYKRAAGHLNSRYPDCVIIAPGSASAATDLEYNEEDAEEEYQRELIIDLGLDPEDPDFGELASEGLNPDEYDWESHDYDAD